MRRALETAIARATPVATALPIETAPLIVTARIIATAHIIATGHLIATARITAHDRSKRKERETQRDAERERLREIRRREKQLLREELAALKLASEAATGQPDRLLADGAAPAAARDTPHPTLPEGYRDDDNPFGDLNLGAKFIWVKKRKEDLKQGLTRHDRQRIEQERRAAKVNELAKLKQLREERDVERRLRELEQARLQREADRALLGDWELKETRFHVAQSIERAQIRVKEGRAVPFDLILLHLAASSDVALLRALQTMGIELGTESPDQICGLLTRAQLEALDAAIEQQLVLERRMLEYERDTDAAPWEYHIYYWTLVQTVCRDHVAQHDRLAAQSAAAEAVQAGGGGGGPAASSALPGLDPDEEADALFAEKDVGELKTLEAQIHAKLDAAAGDASIDQAYWTRLAERIGLWKTKARLVDLHRELLMRRLTHLQDLEAESRTQASSAAADAGDAAPIVAAWGALTGVQDDADADADQRTDRLTQLARRQMLEADDGEGHAAEMIADQTDATRGGAASSGAVEEVAVAPAPPSVVPSSHPTGAAAAAAALAIESSGPVWRWQDKYRPRKPRYYNRIHTGFDWNKYNSTHYDRDNPPPKVVQGYKFNLFYPDLIDPSVAPTYKILRDDGYPDTVILRFSAGPPYEDVAFRIVNKDWEYGFKRGFRNSFNHGILQLWFFFKRQHYRR